MPLNTRKSSVIIDSMQEHYREIRKVFEESDENNIIMNGYYVIEKSRVDSHKKILGWIEHLIEKEWFKKEYISPFICRCCKINKLEETHNL